MVIISGFIIAMSLLYCFGRLEDCLVRCEYHLNKMARAQERIAKAQERWRP